MPSLYQEERTVLITRDRESRLREISTTDLEAHWTCLELVTWGQGREHAVRPRPCSRDGTVLKGSGLADRKASKKPLSKDNSNVVSQRAESDVESTLGVSAYASSLNAWWLHENIFWTRQSELTLGTDVTAHQQPWPVTYGCEVDCRFSRDSIPFNNCKN